MGNLGPYQDITTLAKSLGGVDKLIKSIEYDAVKKSAPVLLGVGALIGVGAKPIFDAGKRGWAKYKGSGAAAAEAKDQLKAVVEESMTSNDSDGDSSGVRQER
ncbi:hypothetical protein [Paenarthrobacter sp. C1]|uniref:hypothetical protein n=1 Tax=Paenarthrobacter sp. C1 TaxID=3400220 RepID=UPI003BF5EABB